MNTLRSRSSRKGLLEKLFTSPEGKGLIDAPFIYMFIGIGMSLYAVIGLFRGRMDLGRFTRNVIHYSDNPGIYLFCVTTLFVLGIGLFLWGMRLWVKHGK